MLQQPIPPHSIPVIYRGQQVGFMDSVTDCITFDDSPLGQELQQRSLQALKEGEDTSKQLIFSKRSRAQLQGDRIVFEKSEAIEVSDWTADTRVITEAQSGRVKQLYSKWIDIQLQMQRLNKERRNIYDDLVKLGQAPTMPKMELTPSFYYDLNSQEIDIFKDTRNES